MTDVLDYLDDAGVQLAINGEGWDVPMDPFMAVFDQAEALSHPNSNVVYLELRTDYGTGVRVKIGRPAFRRLRDATEGW